MTKTARKERLYTQVAALPIRHSAEGPTEVLLVTSRDSGRWIIPKGWPMDGKSDWDAAATEALEEAGVVGSVEPEAFGEFTYFKRRDSHFDMVDVTVYRLQVARQLADWPERDERRACWFAAADAADLVLEPGLANILRRLA